MVRVLDVGVLQLHHPDGQTFSFEPGGLSMAFAVTGHPFDDRFETLRHAKDLAIWATTILDVGDVTPTTADLARAKRLRMAIWQATEAVIDGRAPGDTERRVLNDSARPAPMRPRLQPDGRSTWASPVKAEAVLAAIAADAIDLFGGPRAARLKRCQGMNCAIPFVDTSIPGTRRWCSMDRCGNRAKARAHYHHHRQEVSR
jgi:predicted RNA-binding Zn ribbon-like protein